MEWEKDFDKNYWIYFEKYYPEKEKGLFGNIKQFIREKISEAESKHNDGCQRRVFYQNGWNDGFKKGSHSARMFLLNQMKEIADEREDESLRYYTELFAKKFGINIV